MAPHLQEILQLPNVDLADAQDEDSGLAIINSLVWQTREPAMRTDPGMQYHSLYAVHTKYAPRAMLNEFHRQYNIDFNLTKSEFVIFGADGKYDTTEMMKFDSQILTAKEHW